MGSRKRARSSLSVSLDRLFARPRQAEEERLASASLGVGEEDRGEQVCEEAPGLESVAGTDGGR